MLARMIRALKLDSSLYEEVEKDQGATGQAALVVIIVSVIGGLGALLTGGVMATIVGIVVALIGWVIWSLVTYFVGTLIFGGKSNLGECLRALGFAYTPHVFGIIPFIGWLIALVWTILAYVIATRQAMDFSTGKAIGTVILSFVVLVILLAILMVLGLGGLLGMGALAGSAGGAG